MTDLLDAIEQGKAPLAGIAVCRTALQVTAAIYKSAVTGEVVKLPITPNDPWYSSLPPDGYGLP